MSDFFGSILDNLRGSVHDANSFFGATMTGTGTSTNPLGSAVARALVGGSQAQNNASKLSEASSLSKMDNVPDQRNYGTKEFQSGNFNARASRSADYEQVEQAWLARLHRFAQIDSGLQAGKINEGPDR